MKCTVLIMAVALVASASPALAQPAPEANQALRYPPQGASARDIVALQLSTPSRAAPSSGREAADVVARHRQSAGKLIAPADRTPSRVK